MELKAYLKDRRTMIDEALEAFFPKPEGLAGDVVGAMRYSLFAGGKRLRPILCLAGAAAVGGKERDVLPVACAFELIHTYSLIHDDLPVMDDDDLRRGKPTNHKVYGEAMALLAGDGLLTEAFGLMTRFEASPGQDPGMTQKVIGLIAQAAGHEGMVGGQVVDMQSEGREVNLETVQFIHTRKTGALIAASVTAGSILGGGDETQVEAIGTYGREIGLAFQIADDILDIEGDTAVLGKAVGGDVRKKKITYPSVLGLQRSKQIQTEVIEQAVGALDRFGPEADPLRSIAKYIIERKK